MAPGRPPAERPPLAVADARQHAEDVMRRAWLAIEASRDVLTWTKALLEGARRLLDQAKHQR